MKKYKLLILSLFFSVYFVNGQVGIGTVNPQAQLEVVTDATATSERKGIQVDLNSTSTAQQNTYSLHLTNSSSPSLVASKYGIFSNISGAGTATRYGIYSEVFQPSINPTGTDLFGVYSLLGLSTGVNKNAYGFYADITNVNNTANIYGVYSTVAGTVANQDVYSGYFLGGKFSIGQTTTDNYILPDSRGTANQIMQTDGVGNVTWVNATSVGDDDHDWYEEGTATSPDDINDDQFTMGNVAIGKNTANWPLEVQNPNGGRGVSIQMNGSANTATYGLLSEITNTSDATHVGLFGRIFGDGDGAHRALETSTTGSGSGPHYGLYSSLTGTGTGPQFGVRAFIGNLGDDAHYGAYNELTGTGAGIHYGVYNRLVGSGTGEQYGVYSLIGNNGDDLHFGSYNILSGSGSGEQVGTYNTISNSGNAQHFGVNNFLSGSGTGIQVGTSNNIGNTGSNYQYGVYNVLGSGPGDQIGMSTHVTNGLGVSEGIRNAIYGTQEGIVRGVNNSITGTGSGSGEHIGILNQLSGGSATGNQYGVRNRLLGTTGTGNRYGTHNFINSTTPGTHYGVFSEVLKSGSYAGFFLGNVSIGTTLANNYILPPSRGTNGQIMQTDGSGNVSWVDKDIHTFSMVRANLTANQGPLGVGGWQKVTFDATAFDANMEFNTGLNRFVANTAGYYRINAGFHTNYQNNKQYYSIGVYVNGVLYQESSYNHPNSTANVNGITGSGDVMRSISCLVQLSSNDYVEIYVQNYQGSDATNGNNGVVIDSYNGKTYFEIQRVR